MHNYESCSLEEYAQTLRARVKAALPEGTVVLSDKGEDLYFARLPRENREQCGARVKETDFSLECARFEEEKGCENFPNRIDESFEFEAELFRIGFQCIHSNGGILLSPRAEMLIEFERRFPPQGFLTRSLERFRNSDSEVDSSGKFENLNAKMGAFENLNASDGTQILNSSGEFRGLNPRKSDDESAKFPSEEELKLFSEGLKLIERPEPSKVKAYLRRVREFAAVGLRTGRGGGCYACARIAEELEK